NRRTGEKYIFGRQYIVEKKGEPNPIALVSGEDIGRRANDAYLKLPDEEKRDIRYSAERYSCKDLNSYDKILGFACNPFKTKTEGSRAYYPEGYAWVAFQEGGDDILSREA